MSTYEAVTGLCTLVSSAIQPNAKLNKPKACVAHINHERTLPAPATTYLVVGKLLLSRRNTGPTMRDTRKLTFKNSHRRVGSQNMLGGKRGGTAGGQVQRYRGFTCFHMLVAPMRSGQRCRAPKRCSRLAHWPIPTWALRLTLRSPLGLGLELFNWRPTEERRRASVAWVIGFMDAMFTRNIIRHGTTFHNDF